MGYKGVVNATVELKTFAQRVRHARVLAGYTSQEKFAEAGGWNRKTPQRWESGTVTPRDVGTLRKISELTGFPIAWYLEAVEAAEEEEMESQARLTMEAALARYVDHAVRRAVSAALEVGNVHAEDAA